MPILEKIKYSPPGEKPRPVLILARTSAIGYLSKEHLHGPAIRLDDSKMRSVERALLYALGLAAYHL